MEHLSRLHPASAAASPVQPDVGLELGIEAIQALVSACGDADARIAASESWATFLEHVRRTPSEPLARACRCLDMQELDLMVALAALALQIEPRFCGTLARAARDTASRGLTVALVLDVFCDDFDDRAHLLRRLAHGAPLRLHQCIRVHGQSHAASDGVLGARIEATSAWVRAATGLVPLHPALSRVATWTPVIAGEPRVVVPPGATDALWLLAEAARGDFGNLSPPADAPWVLISGPTGTGKSSLVRAFAAHAQLPAISVDCSALPPDDSLGAVIDELAAEHRWSGAIITLESVEAVLRAEDHRRNAITRALSGRGCPVLLCTSRPEELDESIMRRSLVHIALPHPDSAARARLWKLHLPGADASVLEQDVEALAHDYDFDGAMIRNAVALASLTARARAPHAPQLTTRDLQNACRRQLQARHPLLASAAEGRFCLDDIVLSEEITARAKEIVSACRHRTTVLHRWGFGSRIALGTGITALFDGPPGTGKTLLAEVLATELERPLYRVSLPDIVSKWVGETEKHIRDVFCSARAAHAVLLFDEADALFASRSSEVKSSTDRYANMEVNLLLQEVERFPGLCVLTTNHSGALDPALLRRIQFRATFSPPGENERKRIWQSLSPILAPLDTDVDFEELARDYDLVGGHIKNAFLRAAYAAAEAHEPITQSRLRAACREECRASGKLVREDSPTQHLPRPELRPTSPQNAPKKMTWGGRVS